MYPDHHAKDHPDQPGGDHGPPAVTFGEYEARCNRLAHLFRQAGLRRLDHVAVAACDPDPVFKCPSSVDFEDELPRLPTGKLYKRLLRDCCWDGRATSIV